MYGPKAGNNPWDALSQVDDYLTAIENFDKLPVVDRSYDGMGKRGGCTLV